MNEKKKRDWSKYTASAKKSGEVTFYISQEAIDKWENDTLTGERGASDTYSNIAIETCLMDAPLLLRGLMLKGLCIPYIWLVMVNA